MYIGERWWTTTIRGETLLFAGFKETSVIQAGGRGLIFERYIFCLKFYLFRVKKIRSFV